MKFKSRLLSYFILLIILFFIPLIYNSIVEYFNGDRGDFMVFGILSLILISNIIFSILNAEFRIWKKVLLGITVFAVSFIVSVVAVRLKLKFENDWLGLWTLVIANSVFPILCWEVIYRFKKVSNGK